MNYEKVKAQRKYKYKEERTAFELALREWVRETKTANYILLIIAMLLLGIFLRMVFG